jgi:hypothetical protein
MLEELSRFVDAVVFEDEGGLETLLTATYTIADANVARIYGIDAPAGWQRVELGARRPGILTRAGILAAQATSIEPDPIHRGVLINRNVVCSRLPSPPNDIPPLPMLDPSRTYTLRMRIEAYTGEGTCGARCHAAKINPVGFAFEHFDAIGAWRDTDNGLPVDAAARYVFETGEADFEDAAGLLQSLATEPQVHACYALHWVEYLMGRGRSASDAGLVESVGRASLEQGLSVREVILALVSSRAFRERTSTELGDVRESGFTGAP